MNERLKTFDCLSLSKAIIIGENCFFYENHETGRSSEMRRTTNWTLTAIKDLLICVRNMCPIRPAGQPFKAHIQWKSEFSPLDSIEKILTKDFIFLQTNR